MAALKDGAKKGRKAAAPREGSAADPSFGAEAVGGLAVDPDFGAEGAADEGVVLPPSEGGADLRGVGKAGAWGRVEGAGAATLSVYLRNEYPQTAAVVLGRLNPTLAAEVLASLPENYSVEVQMRMLRMERVRPEIMDVVTDAFLTEFMAFDLQKGEHDNHDVLADILARMDPTAAERFLHALYERNRESAAKVRGDLFFFEMLPWIDEGAFLVLAEADDADIAGALRQCPPETARFVLRHVPAERLGGVLEAVRGSEGLRPEDAAASRDRIVVIAKRLEAAGRIEILQSFGGQRRLADIDKLLLSAPGREAEAKAAREAEEKIRAARQDEMRAQWEALAPGGNPAGKATEPDAADGFDALRAKAARALADAAARAARGEPPEGSVPGSDPDSDSGSGPTPEVADAGGWPLRQDVIDRLLGFDDDDERGRGDTTGIQAILNSALVSYERLPMLEVVFDRMVRILTTSLRNFTSDNVEVSLDNILSLRFGDYLNSIPLPAMIAVFKAEEWDDYGLLTIDSSLIYSMVDVLLGGRRGTAAMRIEGRPYTTIERNLIERLVHVVLADLSASFDPLSPVTFRFDRLETNPRFATISRPSNAAIVTKMRIDMEDRGGRMELLLPYSTLEPVRELLLQMFMGEKFGRDTIWETHLAEELWASKVEVAAVLAEKTLSLSELSAWKVGDFVALDAAADGPVILRGGGVDLGVASAARRGGRFAAAVERMRGGGDDGA